MTADLAPCRPPTFRDGLAASSRAVSVSLNDRSGSTGCAMTDSDYLWSRPSPAPRWSTSWVRSTAATFRWKADDLGAAGLRTRIGASSLTLGGLLKHLAVQEDYAFTVKLTGEPMSAAGTSPTGTTMTDWEFTGRRRYHARTALRARTPPSNRSWRDARRGAGRWRSRPARAPIRPRRSPRQPAPASSAT